jgi:hypothetical protein
VLLLLRLLLRLLLLLLLLLRLSERQNARGVLGLMGMGNPQSLLVDGAGRERTSAAERGERSGDLPWPLAGRRRSVTTDRRIVRGKIHQEAERVAIRSTQLMSASRTHWCTRCGK